jgi:hypothetical protein
MSLQRTREDWCSMSASNRCSRCRQRQILCGVDQQAMVDELSIKEIISGLRQVAASKAS